MRYVNRKIPVVMEDFAPAQVLLYGRDGSIEYLMDNIDEPTRRRSTPPDYGRDLRAGPLREPRPQVPGDRGDGQQGLLQQLVA